MRKTKLVEATKKAFKSRVSHKDEEPTADIHKDDRARSCRKRHCAFRPLNMLFSDEFAEEFGNISSVTMAGELTKKDKSSETFWTKVQQVFIHHHPVHGKSQCR